MSVEINKEPASPTDQERREAEGARMPFEGVVEVGGALGPSFEAQAIDVSQEGIHLRTAYLPELGQPLTCRIEVGSDVVLAAGEVVWRQEEERGGEFGMRFTELDAASEAALKKLVSSEPVFAAAAAGTRVRLHIEGLGSPMRARVKGSAAEGLVVGSELGFLQVGKELELEDARTGGKLRDVEMNGAETFDGPQPQRRSFVGAAVIAQRAADDVKIASASAHAVLRESHARGNGISATNDQSPAEGGRGDCASVTLDEHISQIDVAGGGNR